MFCVCFCCESFSRDYRTNLQQVSSSGCSSACVAPAKRGDFVFEVQIAFISITKDAGLPNVPDFNEALTVVFTSVSRVPECTSAGVGPTTPQTRQLWG